MTILIPKRLQDMNIYFLQITGYKDPGFSSLFKDKPHTIKLVIPIVS